MRDRRHEGRVPSYYHETVKIDRGAPQSSNIRTCDRCPVIQRVGKSILIIRNGNIREKVVIVFGNIFRTIQVI